jgi:hypothetical protein
VSHREEDLRKLRELLEEERLTDWERDAFGGMLESLDRYHQITDKQREIVASVYDRFHPEYGNLVSSGKVPRGREVETPKVLQNLPKRPPGR